MCCINQEGKRLYQRSGLIRKSTAKSQVRRKKYNKVKNTKKILTTRVIEKTQMMLKGKNTKI
jgi:hypothetical protein